ncbi:uncharacterized protein BKA78DRAFT_299878 [Phyllosticta capitalensis]|uniref:uncharacterized protein n=1 Tax=Phyllosticta capitalensis TaxID=121624 RepID=UPI00312D9C72
MAPIALVVVYIISRRIVKGVVEGRKGPLRDGANQSERPQLESDGAQALALDPSPQNELLFGTACPTPLHLAVCSLLTIVGIDVEEFLQRAVAWMTKTPWTYAALLALCVAYIVLALSAIPGMVVAVAGTARLIVTSRFSKAPGTSSVRVLTRAFCRQWPVSSGSSRETQAQAEVPAAPSSRRPTTSTTPPLATTTRAVTTTSKHVSSANRPAPFSNCQCPPPKTTWPIPTPSGRASRHTRSLPNIFLYSQRSKNLATLRRTNMVFFLIGPLLGLAGFGPGGIIAGSVAAAAQSFFGVVAAGGVFAVFQSAAMGGYGVGVLARVFGFWVPCAAAAVLTMVLGWRFWMADGHVG